MERRKLLKLLGLAIAGVTVGVSILTEQEKLDAGSMRWSISTPDGYVEVSLEELKAIIKQRVSHLTGPERTTNRTDPVYVVADNNLHDKIDLDRMIISEMQQMVLQHAMAHGA
jgi:hypothetical protein